MLKQYISVFSFESTTNLSRERELNQSQLTKVYWFTNGSCTLYSQWLRGSALVHQLSNGSPTHLSNVHQLPSRVQYESKLFKCYPFSNSSLSVLQIANFSSTNQEFIMFPRVYQSPNDFSVEELFISLQMVNRSSMELHLASSFTSSPMVHNFPYDALVHILNDMSS